MDRIEKMKSILSNRLKSLTIVGEGTHLRHNMSAIIRSAESFGVQKVHLISEDTKKMSGAAKGGEKWVDLSIYENTDQCLDFLKDQGYSLWVADLHPNASTPDTLPIDKPVAIIMGTELSGVSDRAKELADGFVIVPMFGMTQSLNVSVASACLLQRLSTRIREKHQGGDLTETEQQEILQRWIARDEKEKQHRQNRIKLADQRPQ